MALGNARSTITLFAAVLLCLWVAGFALASTPGQIGPINYEWYQDGTHKAKVEETFAGWEYLQTIDPTGSLGWFKGAGLNCWEYTVDMDLGLESNSFTVHASQITLASVENANGWVNPATGVPLNDITWSTAGTNYLDGQTGMFRMWSTAQRGIITGSLHIVGDGDATGPVSGPVNTPEPGSLALLACGAVGLLPFARRKLFG